MLGWADLEAGDCKHCGHGDAMHYDDAGNRGCAGGNWSINGVPWCRCPGYERKAA